MFNYLNSLANRILLLLLMLSGALLATELSTAPAAAQEITTANSIVVPANKKGKFTEVLVTDPTTEFVIFELESSGTSSHPVAVAVQGAGEFSAQLEVRQIRGSKAKRKGRRKAKRKARRQRKS